MEVRQIVITQLGIHSSNELERYLGLPSLVGKRKKESFQAFKDKMKQRIDNWCMRLLSQGGKEIFIKSVLQVIPTYSMAYFFITEDIMWWNGRHCSQVLVAKGTWKKGIHWCLWRNMCSLKEVGGMGFRIFCQFNVVLLAKQGWSLINNPSSLLARVFKAKYYP